MRSWDPWHCRPKFVDASNQQVGDEVRDGVTVVAHYRILVDALVMASQESHALKLSTMKIRISPMWIFDTQTPLGKDVARLATVVGNLECFELEVPEGVEPLV